MDDLTPSIHKAYVNLRAGVLCRINIVGGKIEMSYKIKVDEKNKLVHTTRSGTMAVDVALQHTMEARALADKHEYTRLLFDIRKFKSRPSMMQVFSIAAQPEERGLTSKYKRATVFSGDEQKEDLRFFENVSVNRGYKVGCFTSIKKAIEWLTGG